MRRRSGLGSAPAFEPLEGRALLAAVNFTGTQYAQNFDALGTSGTSWTNDSTIAAWSLFNKTPAAITAIVTSDGTNNSGSFYNFGTTAAADRAVGGAASGGAYFGSPTSGSVAGWITVAVANNTGVSQNAFNVRYDGEQWRNGGNAAPQTMVAEYGYGSSFAGVSSWVSAGPAFNFTSPVATATAAALDGNASANRVANIGGTVTPATPWAAGTTLWIRWVETNDAGNDHGLAIDNFSFNLPTSVVTAPTAPTITSITAGDGQLSVAFAAPSSDGGAPIVNYHYSLNGGTVWTTPAPAVTSSPLVITGLTNGQTYSVVLRAVNSAGPGTASAAVSGRPLGTDYLRIVSYNITAADTLPRAGLGTLVQAMAAESVAGHADQVDLLAIQEVASQGTTSANVAATLNSIYGTGTYAFGGLNGTTTGSGTQGVVYNTQALQLLEERAVGTASTTGGPRQTLRYKFQPKNGDSSAVFYVYNSHWKSLDTADDAARRDVEARAIRTDADALPDGTSIIYVGDYNLYRSSEPGYQTMLGAGNGQAFDPINRPGDWHSSSSFVDIFTQAPLQTAPSGFTGGGLDDRFDFQLVSGEVMTGGGLKYKPGSYRTFGNNGSVPRNGSINSPGSTALPGLANRIEVLDLLTTVADHLPVVVDYSYPRVAAATPAITVTPSMLAAPLTTTFGTASSPETFSLSGLALSGSLTVTPPTGLEVSLSAGSGYAASLALAPTGGTLAATTVYVRLTATAAVGSYNTAAITITGGGATARTVVTTAGGNTVSPSTGTTLFSEDFAALTIGNSSSTSGSSTSWTGSSNWSSVTAAYQAGGAVKLGTSSAAGSITTKTLDLTGNGGAFTVSFDVKGWTTVEGSIVVTVSGLAPQTVTYSATMSGAFETKTLSFTGGQANSTITFATTAKRAFLDTITVIGGSPEPPRPASIAGFAWNDANGNGTWDLPAEVAAAGWTIYLDTNRDGQLDAGEPSTATGSDGGYSFTGLAAGTYTVGQVAQAGWQQTSPATTGTAAVRSVSQVWGAQADSLGSTVLPSDPAYAPEWRLQEKRFVPNDPLFTNQWHLRNTGQSSGTVGEDARVVAAWDTAKGAGATIGIVDDGLQWSHPDLSPGYRADLSYDFNGNDADPTPGTGDDHGTSAAGVAAARGNNGIGVSGSAPSASLAGIRLISTVTNDQTEANGLTYKPQDIDIYSNSWGPTDDGLTLEAPGPLTLTAMKNAVQTGRGGLGSIYVWAAGNGLDANDNSNYDGYANSRFTIAVTAVDNRGRQSWYAEPGANILVAAPSSGDSSGADVGITTTDLTGTAGSNTATSANGGDYANDFGGTSSATPLVSGVVALLLEANPALGWRDVQHVLAASARKNDVADVDWTTNGAGKWVNHKYGFGVVDAAAAVNLATTWTNVGPEVSATSGTITVAQAIPDNTTTGITSSFTLGADISIESVEVVLNATHASRGNLQVVLTSPSGTRSILAEKHSDTGDNYTGWTFSTVRNWGESANGTWTLDVSDRTAGTTGTFGSWALNVYGTALAPLTGVHTLTLTAGQAATGINFGNQSLGAVVFDVALGDTVTESTVFSGDRQIIKRGGGTLILNQANTHFSGTVVEAGTLIVAHGDALGTGATVVNATGILQVAAGVTVRTQSITLTGGTLAASGTTLLVNGASGIGLLAIASGFVTGSPGLTVSGNGVVTLPTDRRQIVDVSTLTIDQAGGGRIDIGRGRINIAAGGTTEADLRADVIAGRNAGVFNGTAGIMTTGGKASVTSTNPAVGYRVLTSGAAIVAWAAYGDMNLDGQVNATDISLLNGSGKFGQGSSSAATWAQGDFNYSGGVTTADISLLNTAALFQTGSYLTVAAASTSLASSSSLDASSGGPISPAMWAAFALDSQTSKQTKKRL